MYEVEAKVAFSRANIARLKRELSKLAQFKGESIKKDVYYENPKKFFIRLRKEGNDTIFSLKVKNVQQGIEANTEIEWGIKDHAKFHNLLKKIGIQPKVTKEKHSQLYQYKTFQIELNYLPTLGHYLEIETIVKTKKDLPKAKKALIDLFLTLGFRKDRFESKYYLDLLREKK